ncbi:MAG: BREX-6 system phosphatase PglZ, partial [Myxococcales bacterium]|nr:BREX-6 system phosphatase PglZ [Myxococcales bacterium]
MTLSETLGGPVSAFVETELRNEARKNGILAWLDADRHYVDFVERLVAARNADTLPYPVYRFRGSHLELMLELEDAAKGSEKSPMVLYLPGFNETTIADTPLLELYAAGKRYRRALGTAVTEAAAGKVRPDQITTFLSQPNVTLEAADTWLSEHVTHGEAGLGSQLAAMQLPAIFDDLLSRTGFLAGRVTIEADQEALFKHLTIKLGLPEARGPGSLLGELLPGHAGLKPYSAQEIAFLAAAWAMVVEYVNDLKRKPEMSRLGVAAALPAALVKSCTEVAAHLRNNQPDFYRLTARDAALVLAEEVKHAKAEDLGKIDTFRFEEDTVLEAALRGLLAADGDHTAYEQAAHWAKLRLEPKAGAGSFWLKESPTRHSAWQLIEAATKLGLALDAAGSRLGSKANLDEVLTTYAERGAAVDHAHRVLEQRRVALLFPQLPEFDLLRDAL